MTKWVFQHKLGSKERERIKNGDAFLPTKELKKLTGLPEVAITEAVYDIATDQYLGRDYKDVYPRGYKMPGESWAGPNLALKYAKEYIREALDYFEPKDAALKIRCVRSAELLLMHSCFSEPWDGTAESWRLLGEIYYNDWGDENYWFGANFNEHNLLPTYPKLLKISNHNSRALYCFKKGQASKNSDVESSVFLGECYLYGVGCEVDQHRAFETFSKTWRDTLSANARCVGRCALNLANCFEYGYGCKQSFEESLSFYQKSFDAYTLALDQGEDLLEPFLVKAEKGLNRCLQELEYSSYGFRHSYRPRRYCD